jgi:hypothetical protein
MASLWFFHCHHGYNCHRSFVSQSAILLQPGVYYTQVSGGYNVVAPPVNIVIINLPSGFESIQFNGSTYYYYNGTFYAKTNNGYSVIKAPVGAVITNIPGGGKEEQVDGQNYVLLNNTYFLPIIQNGKNVYQVVELNS